MNPQIDGQVDRYCAHEIGPASAHPARFIYLTTPFIELIPESLIISDCRSIHGRRTTWGSGHLTIRHRHNLSVLPMISYSDRAHIL